MAVASLVPNVPLTKQVAASAIPPDAMRELDGLFAKASWLEPILKTLVARIGAVNINWGALIKVVLGSIAGGPVAVITAILMNLSSILVVPTAHALSVAQQLVAQAAIHGGH